MKIIFHRHRHRQRQQAARAATARQVLRCRALALTALHEADENPYVVELLVSALDSYSAALDILASRIPDHPELCEAIASKPNIF
jgi:hypothetical protein